MNIDYVRASTISTFKDCEFKFYLQYVIGFNSESGRRADYGTVVHAAAELLAKAKKTGHYKLKDKYTDPDYLLKICWDGFYRRNKVTYTNTPKDYKFCRDSLQKIIDTKHLNPLNLNVFKTEHQFEIDLNHPGFSYEYFDIKEKLKKKGVLKLRGTIDLITIEDEETLHVIDWKTGKRSDWITGKPKELEDFQKDEQLRIYDLALSVLFPQYKYRMFTIVFINDGGPFTVTFSNKDVPATIDNVRRTFNHIKYVKKPSRLKDDSKKRDQIWKCKHVCHFGKMVDGETGKSLCDLYYNYVKYNSPAEAERKLYELSIRGKPIEKSRRNDYNRQNIHKAKLHDAN